jgi:hypothetical protein
MAMNKRISTLVLGTALAVLAGGAFAQVPTTIQYVGEATVFVPGTAVSAPANRDQANPPIYYQGEATIFLPIVTAPAAPGIGRVAPLGHQVSGNASRVIDLTSRRSAINVTAGETVQFNLDGRSVTWNFDTLGTPVFSLTKIVPQAPNLMVYVSRNPLETGS